MSFVEMIIYVLLLAGLSLLIGFLCVFLPNFIKKKQPKRHHYTEPATDEYKKTAHPDLNDAGSSVDRDKALSSFNS